MALGIPSMSSVSATSSAGAYLGDFSEFLIRACTTATLELTCFCEPAHLRAEYQSCGGFSPLS